MIYQFFDTSHHLPNVKYAYEFADFYIYPAISAGPYDTRINVPLSDLFQSEFPYKFDVNSGQLRVLMNTSDTLNPYSSLSIRRYDRLDPGVVKKYEEDLRAAIRALPRDKNKTANYKLKLQRLWNVKN